MIPKLSLVILAFAAISCNHVYYAPNTANAPLLTEKGETRFNAMYCAGGDSEFDGGELQAACAVSKNVGVMMNFFSAGKTQDIKDYYSGLSSSSSHVERGSGSYIEFAGGMFTKLDKSKKWVVEVYAGTGFGTVKNEYSDYDNSKVGIIKFFIQPALGYKVKSFEFALVPKVSLVDWNLKESNFLTQNNESDRLKVENLDGKKGSILFEPAVLLRGGGQEFKFQLGLSFCEWSANADYDSPIETLNASFGVSINIKPKKN